LPNQYIGGPMRWYRALSSSHLSEQAKELARQEALEAYGAFSSFRQVKTASKGQEGIHLFVDPRYAEKYKINIHLMDGNDQEREAEGSEGNIKTAEISGDGEDFSESTITFVSKRASDPNYVCTVVLQKPEGKVWSVSAYLMETYLGRYAYRADYYFREKSRKGARKCYDRVARAMREMRQDVIDDDLLQNAIPRLMRKRLSSIEGEVEPKINRMATYLDPNNKVEPIGPETSPALYLPNKRNVTEDLMLEG